MNQELDICSEQENGLVSCSLDFTPHSMPELKISVRDRKRMMAMVQADDLNSVHPSCSVGERRELILHLLERFDPSHTDKYRYGSNKGIDQELKIPHRRLEEAVSKAVEAVHRGNLRSLEDVHKSLLELVKPTKRPRPTFTTLPWFKNCVRYACIIDLMPLWDALSDMRLPMPIELPDILNCPGMLLNFTFTWMTHWFGLERLKLLKQENECTKMDI